MTIKVNFLQANSYNPVDFQNQFGALIADGVCTGLSVAQHSTANLSVDVALGSCMKSGLFLNSDALANVPITANTSGYSRIDVIAADLDNSAIVAVMGTPSSSPTAPTLTGNKLALAQVMVGNNVSVINTSNITDVRVQSAADIVAYSLGASGYIKFRLGLIIQWGTAVVATSAGSTANFAITFPITFPTACDNVQLSIVSKSVSASSKCYTWGANTPTTSGVSNCFVYDDAAQNDTVRYVAMGR